MIERSVFICPRCCAEVEERFYGPCGSCREELREHLRGERQELVGTRFEPRMHVVANHVATKE
ncbi:MAG: hypothetical protein ACYC1D_04070 [Acidimicrobiales bacterium]